MDEGYGVKGRRLWGALLTLLIDKGFLKRTKNMGRGYGNLPDSDGTEVGRSSHLTPDIEGSVEELKNRG